MNGSESKASGRERRAFEWISMLARLPERAAGTASEREAAEQVGRWMGEIGISDVSVEDVAAKPRAGLVLALHAAVGALGVALGGVVGALLAALAAFSYRAELRRGRRVLAKLLPQTRSVNVVGRVRAQSPRLRIVLSAHLDAAQAGWLFSRSLADLFARRAQAARRAGEPPAGPNALPEGLLLAAALVAAAHALGAAGPLVDLVRLAAAAGLFVAALLGCQWGFARCSPGANDNASAVAAMLTCAEQLLAQLPPDVELVAVGTGAEEVGCCGMHALLERHPEYSGEENHFVNFECVGGGRLHWIRSEGTLAKSGYPPLMTELARRVAASGAFGEVTATDLLAGTDGHVPAARGLATLSLISLEENGVPRNYHLPEDVPEAIDTSLVVRAADFGAAVAIAAVRGHAGPLAIV